ncbi:MAG: transcription termination/antitermination factor NusG [Verrucomicrobia bacterium]|nr:transcription termination/antitermination factor NusG [Verrucomicrobiota bacterium]
MKKFQWFVIHTLSGQEMKVKEGIERRLAIQEEAKDYIREVMVPVEKVVEVRNGKKSVINRKLFPGYVFINVALYGEGKKINDVPWYFVQATQGAIGFVGGEHPMATPDEDVEEIKVRITESEDTEKPRVNFAVGETVKINDGPFLNFSGVIEEVEPERGKLKVMVSIFGRNTPVELEYWQVEKVV